MRIAIRSDWEIPEEIIEMMGEIADDEQVPDDKLHVALDATRPEGFDR